MTETPTIEVSVCQPAADPEVMHETVISALEDRLLTVSGVTLLAAGTSLGWSKITIYLDPSTNIEAAALDVQAAINAALPSLPSDVLCKIKTSVPPALGTAE
jgi:multidrug efflux pump